MNTEHKYWDFGLQNIGPTLFKNKPLFFIYFYNSALSKEGWLNIEVKWEIEKRLPLKVSHRMDCASFRTMPQNISKYSVLLTIKIKIWCQKNRQKNLWPIFSWKVKQKPEKYRPGGFKLIYNLFLKAKICFYPSLFLVFWLYTSPS